MSTTSELRTKFRSHRSDAKRRGIGFHFTFDRWLRIWQDSGHLHERGNRRGQYVMARFGDQGDYIEGNIKIVQCGVNNAEAQQGKSKSATMRARLSASRKGRTFGPFSKLARQNMSDAHKGIQHSAESITKMRKIAKHRRRDDMGMFV